MLDSKCHFSSWNKQRSPKKIASDGIAGVREARTNNCNQWVHMKCPWSFSGIFSCRAYMLVIQMLLVCKKNHYTLFTGILRGVSVVEWIRIVRPWSSTSEMLRNGQPSHERSPHGVSHVADDLTLFYSNKQSENITCWSNRKNNVSISVIISIRLFRECLSRMFEFVCRSSEFKNSRVEIWLRNWIWSY